MKRKLGSLTCSMLIVNLLAAASFAQSKYEINLYILKSERGVFVPIDPKTPLMSGDKIKISFESISDGYVYLVNIKPSGSKIVIFPNTQEPDNQTRAVQRLDLPRIGGFIIGEQEGTEVFQLILAKERISFFDEAIKEHGGKLIDDLKTSAAAELAFSDKSVKSAGAATYSESNDLANRLQSIKKSLDEISINVNTRMENIEARLDRISAAITRIEAIEAKLDRISATFKSDEDSLDDKLSSGSKPTPKSEGKKQPQTTKSIWNTPVPKPNSKPNSKSTNKKTVEPTKNKTGAPTFLDPNSGGKVIPAKEERGAFISLLSGNAKLENKQIAVFEFSLKVLSPGIRSR